MSNESKRIEKIIVLGGGSAGWMSASYIAKALNFEADVTLIESKDIGRIGVGEATLPTIKEDFFDFLGIDESEWMPKCSATYKMGIKFVNWHSSPKDGGDHYYHIFGEIPEVDNIPFSHLWSEKAKRGENIPPLAYASFPSATLCDHQKSPKHLTGEKAVHYAYHFDAAKVADFLRDWSTSKGVRHIYDNIKSAKQDENGFIKSVSGNVGISYEADLFIDCTGFRAFLIDQYLKEPFISFADSLITDSAVAINIPEPKYANEIRPYTTSTALKAGWLWETPLYGRSGNGYVYSSKFITAEEAEQEVRDHFGEKAEGLDVRHISFTSGKRKRTWVKNVLSVGLSGSFLEPLESTGLYFIYATLNQFIQHFPDTSFDESLQKKFNERIDYMVEDVKEFIVMHYYTAKRNDTAFWRVNRYDLDIPENLKQLLDLQRNGIPLKRSYKSNDALYSTFEASFDRFWTNSNYQAVLTGVRELPQKELPILRYKKDLLEKSDQVFKDVEEKTAKLLDELPSQYDYLTSLREKKKVIA